MVDRIPRLTGGRAIGLALLAAALACGFASIAAAQNYPTRPITLVVPFPPGGSTTIVARIVSDRIAAAIGQQFVVDNRGGGGTLGMRQVARSAPDGKNRIAEEIFDRRFDQRGRRADAAE